MLLLAACASVPEILEQKAFDYGFKKILLSGIVHEHIAFENRTGPGAIELHIYLEGDGSPWLDGRWVASDPTGRNPLMLGLMALDSRPALYLGRPCYHGLSGTAACNPLLWTQRRYSAEVIDSLERAVRNYLAKHCYSKLVFAGHSGGGTLAVLLASRFPETIAVISLAGNLDTDQWSEYHRYSALEGSMNPARLPPLPFSVKEMHFVGKDDDNVLPEFVVPRKVTRPNVEVTVLENFDHSCCWESIWPSILKRITALETD